MQPCHAVRAFVPCWLTLPVLIGLGGCAESTRVPADTPPAAAAEATARPPEEQRMSPPAVVLPLDRPLDEGGLVAAVLARNPSLAAMQASHRAAQARATEQSARPDPVLSVDLAPLSLDEALPGLQVTLTQPLPWPVTQRSRGDAALAAADAAGDDLTSTRLNLVAETRYAFADYWLASGALAANQREQAILAQLSAAALSAYGAGAGERTAVLEAEALANELDHHAVLLGSARSIAIARLNLLVHRPSDAPLPPPPAVLDEVEEVPEVEPLARLALAQRPDLAAATARRQQAIAMQGLARAQSLPEVSLSVGYDSMWSDPDMRVTVGVGLPLPVNSDLHAGARDVALAELQRADAEVLAATDRIQFDVREAHERLVEGWHIVHLLRERMVPTSEAIVAAAQSALASGGHGYSALLSARKELIEMRWQEQQAIADVHHRLADLERVVGGQLPLNHLPTTESP
jgi:cobalt-zinc-cadmium efflux system outer membrane protein